MLKHKNRRVPAFPKKALIKAKMADNITSLPLVESPEVEAAPVSPEQSSVLTLAEITEPDVSPKIAQPVEDSMKSVETPEEPSGPVVEVMVSSPTSSDCQLFEPTIMVEEFDIKQEQVVTETDSASLINCKSYMFSEDVSVDSDLDDTPRYVVEEYEGSQQGSFFETLKTLVNISGSSYIDELGSISSDSEPEATEKKVSFAILEPVKSASYSIIKTTTQFFSDNKERNSDSLNAPEKDPSSHCASTPEVERQPKAAGAAKKQWNLDKITKWL